MKNVGRPRVFMAGLAALILLTALVLHFSSRVSATTFNLSGNITKHVGSDTSAYSGVKVYATAPSSSTILFGPVTSSGGAYALPITKTGTYDIHFVGPVYDTLTPIIASNVTISGATILNEQFSTLITHSLSGTLTDSDSNPLSGVSIQAQGTSSGSGNSTVTTDSNGYYNFPTLPAGKYKLTLTGGMPGITSFKLVQLDSSSINLSYLDMTLNLIIRTANISVTLHNAAGNVAYGVASAKAAFSGANGVISLYPGDPGTQVNFLNSQGFSGSTGTIKTIVGATYDASGWGSSSNSSSICINAISGTYDCLATPLQVTGDTSVDLPQANPATRNFSGVITDNNGTPVQARITLVYGSDTSVYADTDVNGAFSVNAEPKAYALKIDSSAVEPFPGLTSFSLTQNTRAIDLTAGDVVQNLQVHYATLTVTAYKTTGGLNYNSAIDARATSGTTTLYSGDPGETATIVSSDFINVSGDTATGTIGTLVGAQYKALGIGSSTWVGSICEPATPTYNCLTSPLTVTGDMNVAVPQVE